MGDPVVHLFKCDSDDSMYRMLIKDCYVDDGKENKQQIIDGHGCTLDDDIVETPEYTEAQLVVFAEATVFKVDTWPLSSLGRLSVETLFAFPWQTVQLANVVTVPFLV